MSQLDSRPLLIVISGPSGAGKGTAMKWITTRCGIERATTYTTRVPRETETQGVEYNFVDDTTFHELYDKGIIFEYTRTYSDSLYGSPSYLLDATDPAPLAVELDPAGFVRARAASARRVVGIFVTTVTEGELRRRIEARGQGNEVGRRLRIRTDQMTWAWSYDYVVLNDDVEQFYDDLTAIVRAELLKTNGSRRMLELRRETDPTLQEQAAR